MRRAFAAIAALLGVACAPLRSEPLPEVGPPEYGVVSAKHILNERAGETSGERAAWALLSLDPFVLAAAVLAVEDEHGTTQLWQYDVALMTGATTSVRSRYIVEAGQCIVMRRATGVGNVIIVSQPPERCASSPSTGAASVAPSGQAP